MIDDQNHPFKNQMQLRVGERSKAIIPDSSPKPAPNVVMKFNADIDPVSPYHGNLKLSQAIISTIDEQNSHGSSIVHKNEANSLKQSYKQSDRPSESVIIGG